MNILVISDIHSNFSALEAVLQDAGHFDALWCLGDIVGYGPDPNQCIETVAAFENLHCLIGNHDQAALGNIPLTRFNNDASSAAAWTMERLRDDNRAFLENLPALIEEDPFILAHGSPRNPMWEYVLDPFLAERNLNQMKHNYALVGHTHLQLAFHQDENKQTQSVMIEEGAWFQLQPRMILNPGSVGQPRDLDRRAAYALLDLDNLRWQPHRVHYDISSVQMRMLDSGLPERQALRLSVGW